MLLLVVYSYIILHYILQTIHAVCIQVLYAREHAHSRQKADQGAEIGSTGVEMSY